MRICAYKIKKLGAMQDLIKTMKALSDETRLRIMNILLERECCVCEVMQVLDISQTRASRNLGILENAGFLKARRNGAWMYYSVGWEPANHYVASLAGLLKDYGYGNEVLAEDRERLKKTVKVGPGCRRE
ncbi:ArsR/SmtB family transcription factor [Chloroflexota bacterium]